MDVNEYIELAVRAAAECVLWQASDASESGGDGFPITDGSGDDSGREYAQVVIDRVPYITEAVTSFVTDNYAVLAADGVAPGACGHNLVLTANHHGTGFWDRGYEHGDQLTRATRGYSFDAEFRLWGEDADDDEHCSDEIAWLTVENVVLVDELGWSSDPTPNEPAGDGDCW
jgi:hypothetical protein